MGVGVGKDQPKTLCASAMDTHNKVVKARSEGGGGGLEGLSGGKGEHR